MDREGGNREKFWLEARVRRQLKDFLLDVELETGRGCLGILGPSGCGKSMTLKSIAGIAAPESGRIVLEGRQGRRVLYDSASRINMRPQARGVGYLFQNYALFPNMTVEENIGAGLKARRLSGEEIRRRTGEMAERFGLTGLEKSAGGTVYWVSPSLGTQTACSRPPARSPSTARRRYSYSRPALSMGRSR